MESDKGADSVVGFYQAEEQKLADLEKQIKSLKTEQFKKGQVLFGLRELEKELSSELAGGQAQSRNLDSKINQLGDEVCFQLSLHLRSSRCFAQQLVHCHLKANASLLNGNDCCR